MLLSQQGELVRLDKSKAVVRVAPNWLAMVQSRLPLLEQATERALGSPRQLMLETGIAQTHAPIEVTAPLTPVKIIQTNPVIESKAAVESKQEFQQETKQPSPSNGIEVEAKRLAEFFNGEVIAAEENID
jgi:DNA polymerase-3 subunit gamma/tau